MERDKVRLYLPEAEIRTGAANDRTWNRRDDSIAESQIILPDVHVDVSLIYGLSDCRRTSQQGSPIVVDGTAEKNKLNIGKTL